MKLYSLFIGISLVVCWQGCSKPGANENKTPVPVDYKVYTRYSYCGPESQSDTTFYYCTSSKTAFNSYFFFILDHNDNPDTIPSVDFSTKKVVSIVKYGNDFYILSVKGVSLLDKILEVEYSDSLIAQNMTWTISIPIIITTSADFQMIRFIENGKNSQEIIPQE